MFPDRARRLGLIGSSLRTRRAFPLLVECELPWSSFEILCHSVRQYISACLREDQLPPECYGDPLAHHAGAVRRLPNLSPNGVLFPKREVLLEFNLVQRAAARLFHHLGVDEFVHAIQLPVNVRLIDGRPDPVADVRPHASTKLHSDVWAGEAANLMLFVVPLFGDMSTNVEFFEPDAGFTGYARQLADFDDGGELERGCTRYDCQLEPGHGYLMDAFVLHRTLKRGGGLRVSVDLRFLTSLEAESDIPQGAARLKNYAPPADWYGVGTRSIIVPDDTFAACRERIRRCDAHRPSTVTVRSLATTG